MIFTVIFQFYSCIVSMQNVYWKGEDRQNGDVSEDRIDGEIDEDEYMKW